MMTSSRDRIDKGWVARMSRAVEQHSDMRKADHELPGSNLESHAIANLDSD